MYFKTLIVDYDETLAIDNGKRDWDNAIPNIQLINELNRLYADGWTINIYTARGHLSCNSREEAEKTYRPQMEKWLKKHNVSYNLLSFNKPLGVYYIDDKAIRPDEIHKLKEL